MADEIVGPQLPPEVVAVPEEVQVPMPAPTAPPPLSGAPMNLDPFEIPVLGDVLGIGRSLLVGPGAENLPWQEQVARLLMTGLVASQNPAQVPNLHANFLKQNELAKGQLADPGLQYKVRARANELVAQGMPLQEAELQAFEDVKSAFPGLEAMAAPKISTPGGMRLNLPFTEAQTQMMQFQETMRGRVQLQKDDINNIIDVIETPNGITYKPRVRGADEWSYPYVLSSQGLANAKLLPENVQTGIKSGVFEVRPDPMNEDTYIVQVAPGMKDVIDKVAGDLGTAALQYKIPVLTTLASVFAGEEMAVSTDELRRESELIDYEAKKTIEAQLNASKYTDEERGRMADINAAKNYLNQYFNLLQGKGKDGKPVLGPDGLPIYRNLLEEVKSFDGMLDRGGVMAARYKQYLDGDPQLSALMSLRQVLQSKLARALADQKGNLAIYEQQAMLKALMHFTDAGDTATAKYNELIGVLDSHYGALTDRKDIWRSQPELGYFNIQTGKYSRKRVGDEGPKPKAEAKPQTGPTPTTSAADELDAFRTGN